MKKLISALLSITMLLCSTAVVSAVDDEDTNSNCQVVGEDNIPAQTARLYTYGDINSNIATIGIILFDNITFKSFEKTFDSSVDYSDIYLPGTRSYMTETIIESPEIISYCSSPSFFPENSEGYYKKLRLKLSDFSDYFNEDGTHTKDGHNYNFTVESNGYASSLIFHSGGALTAVTPDENGFVEFYFCTNLGVPTRYTTNFAYNLPTESGGDSGLSGSILNGFMVGDADKSGFVDIDDVSQMQKYIAGISEFDSLTEINSDINNDGHVTIDDVTAVQNYLLQ